MSDLIDRQKTINAIANTECHISTSEWNELVDAIISLPSAEKRGRWKFIKYLNKDSGFYKCSECFSEFDWESSYADEWVFCPLCGARMEEQE